MKNLYKEIPWRKIVNAKKVIHKAEELDELDCLVNSPNYVIRVLLAHSGQFLDILYDDENEIVRGEVAKNGFALYLLYKDESAYVRNIILRQGYAVQYFLNDPCDEIKKYAKSI